jgi:UPF0716 protein FxsA
MPILLLLFIGLPLLDTVLLVFLGRYIGFWATIAMVLITGYLGARMARSQGLRVWRNIQQDLAEGRIPSQGVMDGVLILIAGGMLMAPGFLTDILGLSLLIPGVRAPIKRYLRRRLEGMVVSHSGW